MGDAQHIISNQAKCRNCGDVIFSSHVHDYVECSCGAVMVDGGNEYLRCGWNKPSDFIDMSLTMDKEDFDAILSYTKEMYKSRNELGILYGVMRAIRDQGYILTKKEETDGNK
jgi:hypothetical protein